MFNSNVGVTTMFGKSIRNILAVAMAAVVLAGVFGFTAEGKGKEAVIKIKGTDGVDTVLIDEPTSTITCTTCTVTGPVTGSGPWTIDAGGAADNHYKIDTGNGSDMITINGGAGNDKYDIKLGAGDDTVDLNDNAGDDNYGVKGGAGNDAVNYADSPGDEDKVNIDT